MVQSQKHDDFSVAPIVPIFNNQHETFHIQLIFRFPYLSLSYRSHNDERRARVLWQWPWPDDTPPEISVRPLPQPRPFL